MAREIKFKGIDIEKVKDMGLEEFSRLIPSNQRRSLKKGFTERPKKLLGKIKKYPDKFHKTHERDMIIIPEMIDAKLGVYNGKEFVRVTVKPEMIGHRLGEFSMTRQRIRHSSPGAGATRGSKHIPLK
jgi:small subunit ribosomal protein S19